MEDVLGLSYYNCTGTDHQLDSMGTNSKALRKPKRATQPFGSNRNVWVVQDRNNRWLRHRAIARTTDEYRVFSRELPFFYAISCGNMNGRDFPVPSHLEGDERQLSAMGSANLPTPMS